MRLRSITPDGHLDNRDLCARLKCTGKPAGEAYGLYVRARALKPDLNMAGFKALYDATPADPEVGVTWVETSFAPTHRSRVVPGVTCQVTGRTPEVVRFRICYGDQEIAVPGSDPAGMFERAWEPV